MIIRSALFAGLVTMTLLACGGDDAKTGSKATTPSGGAQATAPDAPAAANTATASAATPSSKTDLYTHAFGDPKDPAIVYVHGGPGSNCFDFESTAAPALAAKGFYVIAYDQRGSGRSPKGSASDYSYAGSTSDLDVVLASFGLTSPMLLGHSFGGSIALHYLDRFPGKAKGAIFVASPMDFPDTYKTILDRARDRYRKEGRLGSAADAGDLSAKMFPNGLTGPFAYSATDIDAVMATWADAKLDVPLPPTKDDVSFAAKTELGSDADKALLTVNDDVGNGYEANDRVGEQSFIALLAKHTTEVQGIYAPDQDLMFSDAHLAEIKANVAQFTTIPDASHFIYVDQTDAFVAAVVADTAMPQ